MLCCGWMKAMNFDPIATLELFDPVRNDGIAENVAKAIIAATGTLGQNFSPFSSVGTENQNHNGESTVVATPISSEVTLMDLSDSEIRMFKNKCNDYSMISLFGSKHNDNPDSDNDDDEGLNPAMIVYLRVMTEVISKSTTLSEVKKSNLLSKFVPDITTLTDVLEKSIYRLTTVRSYLKNMDGSNDEDDMSLLELESKEDKVCFVCLQMLQLATSMDLKEEGSRRHLSSIIHRILSSLDTHDDLVKSCVHVLYVSSESEASFIQSISEVLNSAIDMVEGSEAASNDEKQAQFIRALEILTFSLEKISRRMSKNPILQNFSSLILHSISDYSLGPVIRELGISCLGRFVILMDGETVVQMYKVLLMNIALMENEKDAIRAQSLLALCDLALLHDRIMAPTKLDDDSNDKETSLSDILLTLMTKSSNSLLVVSAEVAVKLMCCGRLHDANILAHLITVYFDQTLYSGNENEESDDVNEVGSPTRLQQLMTMFFPAYSMSSYIGRHTLVAAIPSLLGLVHEKMNMKRKDKKKNTSWPIVKMIEYIIDLVESGTSNNDSDDHPISMVEVALSISSFLVREIDDLSTLYTRNLCKVLSKVQLEATVDNQTALQALRSNLDELSICITDDSAINSLRYLTLVLEEMPISSLEVNKGKVESTRPVSMSPKNQDHEHAAVKVKSPYMDDDSISTQSEASSRVDEDSVSSAMNVDELNIQTDLIEPNNDADGAEENVDEDLPNFATIGCGSAERNTRKVSRLSNESEDDVPLFATIGASGKNRRRQIIESSSESESSDSDEFEDSFSSQDSDNDESYSD